MKLPTHKVDSGGKYALGHSEEELDRLKEQARLIDPITQRFFDEAGVGPGMRVFQNSGLPFRQTIEKGVRNIVLTLVSSP